MMLDMDAGENEDVVLWQCAMPLSEVFEIFSREHAFRVLGLYARDSVVVWKT